MNGNSETYTSTPEQTFGREFDTAARMEQAHNDFVANTPTAELNVEAERSNVNHAFEATQPHTPNTQEIDAHGIRMTLHLSAYIRSARSQKLGTNLN